MTRNYSRRLALCAVTFAGAGGMAAMTIESHLDRIGGVPARAARLAIMAVFVAMTLLSMVFVMKLNDEERDDEAKRREERRSAILSRPIDF